ncbi:TldD/PmbA family protein [Tissierella sp. Yu-01]|uniref:TldD/PmbA family protein n=1 Tax=Tissierella sp. Yu-01 TaxID=3035694 RepID=UPI00240D2918|nr:TldD/PmbA family protein [Tissierella sp. Yu-01]WFA09946.1 TldD/PmbA family protein [Tissierella sp. Yu-01]
MDNIKLIDEILTRGKTKMKELETYLVKNKSIEIGVFKGELDKYSISESGGLSLRGIANEKMGYAYTEKLDESSIDMLIEDAFENGRYIDIVDGDEIFNGSPEYGEINVYNSSLTAVPIEDKIEFAKNIEKFAYTLDNRVVAVQNCGYQEFEQEKMLKNTNGVDLHHKQNGGLAYISVVVKDGDDTKTGIGYRVFSNLSTIDSKDIAKDAVDEAISMLGATPIKTGDYPTVIKNKIFADLLEAFTSVFSADSAQKGLSLLKDKVGEEIATPVLTLVDNPLLEEGFATSSFDDEGTSTKYKKVIDKGVLKTLLHNWRTAKKEGIESTGNGSRTSYKSTLAISPSNFYVEKGETSFDDIIKDIDIGVYIISVAGLHSGLNPVSGDFSLSAYGYEILNGKINRPINQITIAGNFFELLKNIEVIGDDLKFGFPGNGYFGSPTVKVKSLSIAGE